MKRTVEYITQQGEVLKLTELISDLTDRIKIYLPFEYRILYSNDCLKGLRYLSPDFFEDEDFRKRRHQIEYIEVINMHPEEIDENGTFIYAEFFDDYKDHYKEDYDKFMRIASKCYSITIWLVDGKFENATYCIYAKNMHCFQ